MTRWERILIQSSSAAMALTGLLYAGMKYLMTTDDPYAVINHPLQPVVLKIHILAAPVLVFAVGMAVATHVRRQWASSGRRGRRTGLPLLALFVPLVLTGYLIQAVTGESWLTVLGYVHLGLGILYAAWHLGHQVAARRRRRRSRRYGAGRAA